MTRQKAVFFLRAYNDIDHMVPVIYKWLTTRDVPVAVVLRTPEEYLKDYRIQFLRQFDNVEIYHIDELLPSKAPEKKGWKQEVKDYVNCMDRYNPIRIACNLAGKVKRRFITMSLSLPPRSRYSLYDKEAIELVLDEVFGDTDRGIVVLDWVAMASAQVDFARRVIEAARKRGFANISLPHGDSPYANKMFKLNDINYDGMDHYGNNPFDYVVVPNKMCAGRYIPHKGADRVKILGSPRYNDEWMNILWQLIPVYENKKAQGKLKIVLFLRNPAFPVFWDEVIRTIKLVIQFPEVYLIVKHHTRSGLVANLIRDYPELNEEGASNLKFVYDDVHSSSLLLWADVVMDLGTSVAFEAIKLGKAILTPEYLHANISTTAYYLEHTAMQCRDDLYSAIQDLIHNPKQRLYTEEKRQRFIQEMIDYPDGNVLDRYVQFLESCLKGEC